MKDKAENVQTAVWRATDSTRGPLDGIRVVDLSRVLAGPLCTQMLADHGADVIKVEPPFGDESRQFGPPFDDEGNAAYYSALNRGKRAMILDLKHAEGRSALFALLEQADVLVENFLPGTLEKWGLGYEEVLRERFPQLIFCSISGFGASGPMGGLPGYDAVMQALSGLMSINGTPDSGPVKIGIPIVDHLTAYTAFSGILMALHARHASGKGQPVEAVLFDTALSLLVPHAANWLHSGDEPLRLGNTHPNIAPYDCFQALDGPVFLSIANDAQFRRLCKHLAREDLLEDPKYASNPLRVQNNAALHREIEASFAQRPREALCVELMKAMIPAAPVNTVPQALGLAHTGHRHMVLREGGYQGLGVPIKFPDTVSPFSGKPPNFAEHDTEIRNALNPSAEPDPQKP
ncbi:MAG: CoA transferase [Castellaniella sp.]